MPRKSKQIYSQYSKESLENIMQAVKNGIMSFSKASQTCGIPKATILDHVNGKIKPGAKPGRKPVIPNDIEALVASKIVSAAEKGFGLSKQQVMIRMARLATSRGIKLRGIKSPVKEKVLGDDWWRGFKARNLTITLRRPEKLSTTRARMMNRVVVSNYSIDLATLISENNLQPSEIWNADETGKQLEHRPTSVVARKGAKNLPGRTGNSWENVTTLACVNAAGKKLPPLCIVKGKTVKSVESFATIDAPPETVWTFQEKAWMCDILGELWFRDIFLKHCGSKRPQILIMDSHGSHETLGLLEKASEENIIILAIPPHTSHHLQPLDKGVFGPFSKAYDRVCSEFMTEHPDHVISKATWPRLFRSAWEDSITPSHIKSGFRATGIWPINPSAVPDSAYQPSDAFETELHTDASESIVTPENNATCKLDTSLSILADAAVSVANDNSNQNETSLLSQDLHVTPSSNEIEILSSVSLPVSPRLDSDIPEVPADDVDALLNALDNGNLTLVDVHEVGANVDIETVQEKENKVGSNLPNSNWNPDLEAIFSIPNSTKKSKSSRSSITCHRLLTSHEIIENKRMKLQEKQQKEKEKEERRNKKFRFESVPLKRKI